LRDDRGKGRIDNWQNKIIMNMLPIISPRGCPDVGHAIIYLKSTIVVKIVLNLHNGRPIVRFESWIRGCPKSVIRVVFSFNSSKQ
jgi:hypothetical protein